MLPKQSILLKNNCQNNIKKNIEIDNEKNLDSDI